MRSTISQHIHVALWSIALVFLAGAVYAPAHAQFSPSDFATFEVTASPRNPEPGETVSLRAESFSVDLDTARITWRADGATIASGVGQKTASVTVGASGSERIISITVVADDITLEETLTLRPTVIDLAWEAQTSYVPPFYRGKALPSQGTPIRVVAMPQFMTPSGGRIAPDDLVYTWSVGGTVLGSKSGAGRQTLLVEELFPFRNTTVRVEVRSLDDTLQGSATVSVAPSDVDVVFYEDHPLLGTLFNRTLRANPAASNDEIVIGAHPFFAGVSRSRLGNLSFVWRVNGTSVENPSEDPSVIVLRRTSDEVAQAGLSVFVSHPDRPLQQGRSDVTIRFRGDSSSPFPGSGSTF